MVLTRGVFLLYEELQRGTINNLRFLTFLLYINTLKRLYLITSKDLYRYHPLFTDLNEYKWFVIRMSNHKMTKCLCSLCLFVSTSSLFWECSVNTDGSLSPRTCDEGGGFIDCSSLRCLTRVRLTFGLEYIILLLFESVLPRNRHFKRR